MPTPWSDSHYGDIVTAQAPNYSHTYPYTLPFFATRPAMLAIAVGQPTTNSSRRRPRCGCRGRSVAGHPLWPPLQPQRNQLHRSEPTGSNARCSASRNR